MSEIQDEAYSEALEEIEHLKLLNSEERATIDELSKLITELADALEWWEKQGDYKPPFAVELIKRAREATR